MVEGHDFHIGMISAHHGTQMLPQKLCLSNDPGGAKQTTYTTKTPQTINKRNHRNIGVNEQRAQGNLGQAEGGGGGAQRTVQHTIYNIVGPSRAQVNELKCIPPTRIIVYDTTFKRHDRTRRRSQEKKQGLVRLQQQPKMFRL